MNKTIIITLFRVVFSILLELVEFKVIVIIINRSGAVIREMKEIYEEAEETDNAVRVEVVMPKQKPKQKISS
jgi:hypothetical protein